MRSPPSAAAAGALAASWRRYRANMTGRQPESTPATADGNPTNSGADPLEQLVTLRWLLDTGQIDALEYDERSAALLALI